MWVRAGKLQRDINVSKTILQSQMTRARKSDCSVNCPLQFSTNKSRYLYWKKKSMTRWDLSVKSFRFITKWLNEQTSFNSSSLSFLCRSRLRNLLKAKILASKWIRSGRCLSTTLLLLTYWKSVNPLFHSTFPLAGILLLGLLQVSRHLVTVRYGQSLSKYKNPRNSTVTTLRFHQYPYVFSNMYYFLWSAHSHFSLFFSCVSSCFFPPICCNPKLKCS